MSKVMQGGISNVAGLKNDSIKQDVAKDAKELGQKSFDRALKAQLQKASGVTFSAHAMQRIDRRNIDINTEQAQKVGKAVESAQNKGAKESLFIGNGYALIVNIPNKTVITAMDPQKMDGTVVTNIDSTVIVS
jgi:flagellar operon protein